MLCIAKRQTSLHGNFTFVITKTSPIATRKNKKYNTLYLAGQGIEKGVQTKVYTPFSFFGIAKLAL